uniref:Uncharacterized protein n=1 Tax=Homalodisca liturata TaxID=320908 RepID=A0A1B6J512_9HEMI
MSSNRDNLSPQTIKFTKISSDDSEEEHDAEILIPNEMLSEYGTSKVREDKIYFRFCMIVSCIFICIFTILIISSASYVFTASNKTENRNSVDKATTTYQPRHQEAP